ncbi:MAG TPA: hypothetical protein VLC92_00755 [Rhodocyclaceae bacterium]|nr:hypothetical protein [Rhodocyclaceae bacterium]
MSLHRNFTVLALTTSLAAAPSAQAAAPDSITRSCTRLLTQSPRLHDPLRVLDRSFHSLRFRDWMCNTGFRTHAELMEASNGLNLPNPGLGSLLGYMLPEKAPMFEKALANFCSTGYQLQTDAAIRENFERTTAASMSDAYQACLDHAPQVAFAGDDVFVYAMPSSASLRDFTLHAQWRTGQAPHALRILTQSNVHCTPSQQTLATESKSPAIFRCTKPAEAGASVTLRTGKSSAQTIMLPGSTEAAVARLSTQQIILADRLRYLETALEQPGAEQEALPTSVSSVPSACPTGSYAAALVVSQAGAATALSLRCRKLPPNVPD